MVIPTTIAEKTSRAVQQVSKALKNCKPEEMPLEARAKICGTCGGLGHITAKCNQSQSQGLAIKSDKGSFLYEKEAVEMHALTAVIVSIAGLDEGLQYRMFSGQLCEMHKVADEEWAVVWQRFVNQSFPLMSTGK